MRPAFRDNPGHLDLMISGLLLLLLLTANGFSPGGSGTTIRQQTKYKLTTIRQQTKYKLTTIRQHTI
jgi:hypothetical protein